jgi:hypothetical protein
MMMAAAMGGASVARATFVGYVTATLPASGGIDFTSVEPAIGAISGIQAGDICLVFVTGQSADHYGSMGSADGAWPQDNYVWTPSYGYRTSVFRKVISAADLAANVFSMSYVPSSSVVAVVYRGATSAVRRTISYDADGDGSQTVPGITRAANCVGVICGMTSRDTTANNFGVTAGWTERMTLNLSDWRIDIADALGAADYVNGANIVWSNLGTSSQVAQVFELLI